MKSKWLNHNFEMLKEAVNEAVLNDEKKLKFNNILLKIFEAIQVYEDMDEENIEFKQKIFEMMRKISERLEDHKDKFFSKFFDSKVD